MAKTVCDYCISPPSAITNGHANGYTDGATNGTSNGHLNGHSNGYVNGQTNGHANSHSNDYSNGHKNGVTNGDSNRNSNGHTNGHTDVHATNGDSNGHSNDHSNGHSNGQTNGVANGHQTREFTKPPDGPINMSTKSTPRLIPISANNKTSLKKREETMKDYLRNHLDSLDSVSYTLSSRREHLSHRTFCIARHDDPSLSFEGSQKTKTNPPSVVFVCTGQGAQWAGMGKSLIEQSDCFRDSIREMDKVLQNIDERPIWTMEGMSFLPEIGVDILLNEEPIVEGKRESANQLHVKRALRHRYRRSRPQGRVLPAIVHCCSGCTHQFPQKEWHHAQCSWPLQRRDCLRIRSGRLDRQGGYPVCLLPGTDYQETSSQGSNGGC